MSQSQTAQQSPYPREDWWGDNDTAEEQPEEETIHWDYETERAQWIAHSLLKDTAVLACPIALNADPNRPAALWEWLEHGEASTGHDPTAMHKTNEIIELTDPKLWLPLESQETIAGKPIEYGQNRHRVRYNPEHGYPVGPQIMDRPHGDFMQVVRAMLEHCATTKGVGLSQRECDKLERDADRMKQAGDRRDTDILATIIKDATGDGPVLEN
ncbi:hypothetical protein ACLI4U_18955 (plasmid) [Natrialbaceae archaeon A-CW2]